MPAVPQSDLPRDPRERACWIAVLASLSVHGSIVPDAMVRYASARYREIATLDVDQLYRVINYLTRSRRRPSRSKPVARLLGEIEDWFEEWARHDSAESRLAALEKEKVVVPAPPFPGCDSGALRITHIGTLRALYEEGERLHHCIFSYWDLVVSRHVAVYHVEAHTEPSTLMLLRDESGWTIAEQRGTRNEPPSDEATAAVSRWLENARLEAARGAAERRALAR